MLLCHKCCFKVFEKCYTVVILYIHIYTISCPVFYFYNLVWRGTYNSFSVVMLLVNGIFVQYTLNKKIIYSKAFHLERIKNVRTPQFRDFLKGALEEVERIKSPKVNIQPSVFLPSLPYSSSHFRFLSD